MNLMALIRYRTTKTEQLYKVAMNPLYLQEVSSRLGQAEGRDGRS